MLNFIGAAILKGAELSWTNPKNWIALNLKEVLSFKEKNGPSSFAGEALSIRSKLRPVDIYCYLIAKFGEPNGMQSIMLNSGIPGMPLPDSGNLFHWDFQFKCNDVQIYIVGMTAEVHVFISEDVSHSQWIELIENFKSGFANESEEKSKIYRRLEKWVHFANPYASIADSCADLFEDISSVLQSGHEFQPMGAEGLADPVYQAQLGRVSERAENLYSKCIQLKVLTPILGEAFINMVTSILAKPDIKSNRERWISYRKSSIISKIENINNDCLYLKNNINKSSEAYKSFMRIKNERNDTIHANVIPELYPLRTVFFDGKIPLYCEGGDIFKNFWDTFERFVNPSKVLQDYLDTHSFFAEVYECIDNRFVGNVRSVIEDSFPGYDAKRQKFGKLEPNHLAHGSFGPVGVIYDDQLHAE